MGVQIAEGQGNSSAKIIESPYRKGRDNKKSYVEALNNPKHQVPPPNPVTPFRKRSSPRFQTGKPASRGRGRGF